MYYKIPNKILAEIFKRIIEGIPESAFSVFLYGGLLEVLPDGIHRGILAETPRRVFEELLEGKLEEIAAAIQMMGLLKKHSVDLENLWKRCLNYL